MPPESFDPHAILSERFRTALAAAYPDNPQARNADPLISTSKNPQFGDYQANGAMALGKALGTPGRDVAKAMLAHLDISDIAEPLTEASIAGPGFINIRLRSDALAALLSKMDVPDLGISAPAKPETIVVDLCGVNLAKQMHVGHIRSNMTGDAIARTFERLGWIVKRQNHVGDWGLNIAMVTAKLDVETKAGRIDAAHFTLDDLERLYKRAQAECDADSKGLQAARTYGLGPKVLAELEAQVSGAEEALSAAKATLVRLQSHDPAVVAVWKRIYELTMTECLAVCARLHVNVKAEHTAGESSYAEELAPLVADLVKRGLAEESDGALVIRVEGFEEPCIIRKGDGGFLYATTDLAAIRRRVQKLGASRVIYCVDARQGLHFKLVFGAAIKAGLATRQDGTVATLEHAAFGTILGKDGRPFKTRSGESVKLADLIDEATERAFAEVSKKNAELPEAERRRIAEVNGVAALKYADLSTDRVRDVVFDFDRMVAFEGNTGPYLLYACVRARSIFREAQKRFGTTGEAASPFVLAAPDEKALALVLLRYAGAVRTVSETLDPYRLCQYLYDLASAFSGFFTNCKIVTAPDAATRDARLKLCRLTERVLADGLNVLGITTLDRM